MAERNVRLSLFDNGEAVVVLHEGDHVTSVETTPIDATGDDGVPKRPRLGGAESGAAESEP